MIRPTRTPLQFFTIGATDGSPMVVSNNALTNDSHGPLSYENSGLQLLHTLALPSDDGGPADGFMSRAFADNSYYAPDWYDKKSADANLTPQGAGKQNSFGC